MRYARWLLVLAPLVVFSFLHGRADELPPSQMEFIVLGSGPQVLEGVEVSLVSKDGLRSLGRTNGVGRISVERKILQEPGALAVLFCSEWYFCGAFRLDDPEFFEYEERLIALAPLQT